MTEGARELWLENLIPLTATYTKHESLLYSVATLHQQQENNQAALDTVNNVLKLNNSFYPAWTMKARLQATLGDNNGAFSTINNALKQFENDKSLTLLKARLHIKKKEINLARDAFLALSKDHSHDAQVLLPLALTQLELGDHQDAKSTLQKLLNLHQLSDEAHYYLGRIEQHVGNDDAALKHYLAMKSGREYLAAQNSIVRIHLKQGNIEQAIDHIQQQRTNDPQNQQAYFLMEVEILNRTGQFEESIKVLNSALTAYADDTDLRYSRAMVSEKLGNLDQLEKDLGYIIDRDPENATALNALGYTLADRTARLEEALKLIEKARNIAPSDPAIIDSLGWVYYRMGRLQEALTLLNQAYEAFPDPEVAAHLGEVLWILGKHDQAKEIWQQGLQKKPNSQIIRDTLDRLQVQL
jgi:tetratricopeptide (TPR) repeat protein